MPQAVLRSPAHSASPRAGAAQLHHPHLSVSLISVSPCRSLAFAHPKNHFGTVLCCPKETCAGAGPGRRAAGPQRSARPRGTEPVPEMETRLLGAPGATMGNVTKSRINAPENPTSGDLLLIPPPKDTPCKLDRCVLLLCVPWCLRGAQRCQAAPGASPGASPAASAFCHQPRGLSRTHLAVRPRSQAWALLGLQQQPGPPPPPQPLTYVPQMPAKPQ